MSQSLEDKIRDLIKQVEDERRLGDKRAEQFYKMIVALIQLHNSFPDLQGGQADQYFHLNATEHPNVSGANAQSLLTTASPSFVNLTLSGNLLANFVDSDAPNPRVRFFESGTQRAELRYAGATNEMVFYTMNAAAAHAPRIRVFGEVDATLIGLGMAPVAGYGLSVYGKIQSELPANNRIEVEDTGGGAAFPGFTVKHTGIAWTMYLDGVNNDLVFYESGGPSNVMILYNDGDVAFPNGSAVIGGRVGAGHHKFTKTSKTIDAGGTITIDRGDGLIEIDTFGGGVTDDLDTIADAGAEDGDVIILKTKDSARDVVIKHLVDNIHCQGGDLTLADRFHRASFICDGTYWVLLSKNF